MQGEPTSRAWRGSNPAALGILARNGFELTRNFPQPFAWLPSSAARRRVITIGFTGSYQDELKFIEMVGTSTSAKDVTMTPRRRSRSEGSTKAALELQASMAQSTRHLERATAFPRFAMTELYVRTSDGVVFQDEDFQRQTIAKAERLVETALSPESSERNALLAKKALKYREMRARKPNHAMQVLSMGVRAQSCPVVTD